MNMNVNNATGGDPASDRVDMQREPPPVPPDKRPVRPIKEPPKPPGRDRPDPPPDDRPEPPKPRKLASARTQTG